MSLRRCCGLVVSVPASRLPVLGSNLSPGPPTVRSALFVQILYAPCCLNTEREKYF